MARPGCPGPAGAGLPRRLHPRGIAFRCSGGMTGRSVPRPARLARSRIAAMGARGGPECGMGADSGFQPSVPRLPWFRSAIAVRHATRATGELTALRAFPAVDPPRVLAGVGDGSAQGARHDRRERGGEPTAASGNGVVCARSRPVSAGALQFTQGRREPLPRPRVLRAQRALPRAAGALLLVRLLATAVRLAAGPRGAPACLGVGCGNVFLRMPCGAIYCR